MQDLSECDDLREKWERARALLQHIELDMLATEELLRADPRDYLREHHKWLRRVQALGENQVRELERALRACVEN